MEQSEGTPYLILTAGPTGAGKSVVAKKVIETLGINNVVHHLIDDLIENSPLFKKRMKEIITENKKICDNNKYIHNKKKCLMGRLILENEEISKSYNDSRKTPPCLEEGVGSEEDKKKTCDELNSEGILNSIKNKKNIVFETTGENISSWLFANENSEYYKSLKENNYTIVFAYSLVDLDEITENLFSRLDKSLNNSSVKTPRLPNFEYLSQTAPKIKITLNDLYSKCFLYKEKYESICGILPMILFVFNNNKQKMSKIFDSSTNMNMNDKDFEKLINKYFNTTAIPYEKPQSRSSKRIRRSMTHDRVHSYLHYDYAAPEEDPVSSQKSEPWVQVVPPYEVQLRQNGGRNKKKNKKATRKNKSKV